MDDQASKVAALEIYVKTIMVDVDEIKDTQKEILVKHHAHDIESEHYRTLIDEIIHEKRAKSARIEAITTTLLSRGMLATLGLILLLAWAGLKGKIFG